MYAVEFTVENRWFNQTSRFTFQLFEIFFKLFHKQNQHSSKNNFSSVLEFF